MVSVIGPMSRICIKNAGTGKKLCFFPKNNIREDRIEKSLKNFDSPLDNQLNTFYIFE